MKERLFFVVAAAALLALAPSAFSQSDSDGAAGMDDISEAKDRSGSKALSALAIKDKELDEIENVLREKEDAVAQARAEIQIVQAKIARALLYEAPNMDGIKALIKESLDSEMKVRLIQIERQLAIRKLIGAKRWAVWVKLMKSPWARARIAAKKVRNDEPGRIQRLRIVMDRLR